ncbi:MAG: hypothetical protein AB7P14_29680 [Blastocatellales bacterium]
MQPSKADEALLSARKNKAARLNFTVAYSNWLKTFPVAKTN